MQTSAVTQAFNIDLSEIIFFSSHSTNRKNALIELQEALGLPQLRMLKIVATKVVE